MEHVVGLCALGLVFIKDNDVYKEEFTSGVACALAVAARLGDSCSVVSTIKDDSVGDKILSDLKELSINCDNVRRTEFGMNPIIVYREEQKPVCYKSNAAFSYMTLSDINFDNIDNASVCVISTNILSAKTSKNTVFSAIRFLKGRGVKIFLNVRFNPYFWGDKQDAYDVISEAVRICDICYISDNEIMDLTGAEDIKTAVFEICGDDLNKIVVVSAQDRCYYKFGDSLYHIKDKFKYPEGPHCLRDVFAGGMLHKYLQIIDKLERTMREDAESMIEFGMLVRNITCKKGGTIYDIPSFVDIINTIKS